MKRNKFYRNLRNGVATCYADEIHEIAGIVCDCVQDRDDKKKWSFYSDTTGVILCQGSKNYCIRWINDNQKEIKRILDTPKFKEFAIDIAYAKEARRDD